MIKPMKIRSHIINLFLAAAFSVSLLLPPAGICGPDPAHPENGSAIPRARLMEILASAEKKFTRINTLQTRLIQEKNISLFSEPVLSKGFLLYKAPDKIRLEFSEPFKSVLMISGNDISKFESFNGKWQRMNPGNKKIMGIILEHIGTWIKGKFHQPSLYEISGRYRSVKAGQAFSIKLVPKAAAFREFIQAFELGINARKDRLDYIIIRESGNDHTKITFHDDLINTPIKDDYFGGGQTSLFSVPHWPTK